MTKRGITLLEILIALSLGLAITYFAYTLFHEAVLFQNNQANETAVTSEFAALASHIRSDLKAAASQQMPSPLWTTAFPTLSTACPTLENAPCRGLRVPSTFWRVSRRWELIRSRGICREFIPTPIADRSMSSLSRYLRCAPRVRSRHGIHLPVFRSEIQAGTDFLELCFDLLWLASAA